METNVLKIISSIKSVQTVDPTTTTTTTFQLPGSSRVPPVEASKITIVAINDAVIAKRTAITRLARKRERI
jgi:hypothetical protein